MHDSSKTAQTLNFESMTPRTREVLAERLSQKASERATIFSRAEFSLLQDLAEFALPQKGDAFFVDLAGDIDTRFAERAPGKGWRYNDLPPAPVAYRLVLAALENSSIENLLQTKTPVWIEHFWEDFLADITETYYAHPYVQTSIRAFGMMDGRP